MIDIELLDQNQLDLIFQDSGTHCFCKSELYKISLRCARLLYLRSVSDLPSHRVASSGYSAQRRVRKESRYF